MEQGSDYLKNRISIKQEIEKIKEQIKQKKQRIVFLENLLTNHTKELFIGSKVVIIIGEYAKDWIEENDTMFPKKKLLTHNEFEDYKAKSKLVELIIVLDYVQNLEEILKWGRKNRIRIDILNEKLKREN